MQRIKANSTTPLGAIRDWLGTVIREGAVCPACDQTAKMYRRRLHATIAKALIELRLAGGEEEFQHTPSLPGDTHEISQASWWGLIEEERIHRPDGGRAGYWKLTEAGKMFVRGVGAIPEYALVYNGKALDTEGRGVTIHDSLGSKFSYFDLMNA